MACSTPNDAWWPALFRCSHRDRLDAGPGVRLAAASVEGLLGSVLPLMGLALAVPDHTTLSRRARTWQSPNKAHDLQGRPDGPVHILVDSTGLQVYGAGQWLEEKHGARSRRGW